MPTVEFIFNFNITTQETFSWALRPKGSHKFSPSSSKIVARLNPFYLNSACQSALLIRWLYWFTLLQQEVTVSAFREAKNKH